MGLSARRQEDELPLPYPLISRANVPNRWPNTVLRYATEAIPATTLRAWPMHGIQPRMPVTNPTTRETMIEAATYPIQPRKNEDACSRIILRISPNLKH